MPGIEGVFGFGLGALVEGPAMGDGLDADVGGAAAAATVLLPTAGVATILRAAGHKGPISAVPIYRLSMVQLCVSVSKAVACVT